MKNFTKKQIQKRPKQPNNILKLELITADATDLQTDQLIEIVEAIPFNKISIPVNVARTLIDHNAAADDKRVVTVGYIKGYDFDEHVASVFIYPQHLDAIKNIENPALETFFITDRDGNAKTITKFNIVAVDYDSTEE